MFIDLVVFIVFMMICICFYAAVFRDTYYCKFKARMI